MSNIMTVEGTATITEIDGRYLLVEFQDYKGNVCYFHTDARVTWLKDGNNVQNYLDNSEMTDSQINEILSY